MVRLFEEHLIRRTELLSGAWQFVTDPKNVGLQQLWKKKLPETASTVVVPSCWNNELNLFTYEGVCWYSRTIHCRCSNIRLIFEAVMTAATVFLDGKEIASHYGGYTAFEVTLRDISLGEHTLTLRVDNSFDENAIPMPLVDWYHYGGIIRDVDMEELSGIVISSQYITYELSADRTAADITCHAVLESFAAEAAGDTFSMRVGDTLLAACEVSLQPGEQKEMTLTGHMDSVRLWAPGQPNLYMVTLATSTDDWRDRIGLRTIEAKNRQILLNGKPFFFRGICRHEELPDDGFAFPRKMLRRDVDILMDMNCNAVRGSHYPNSKTFLDYLDERGLCFWSEIPLWGGGFSEEALASPVVLERGMTMHREMIAQYRNHPCVIFWSLHNEIMSETPNGKALTKYYYEEVKKLDDSRLITYATNRPLEDECYEYCDVYSVNRYIGWYDGVIDEWAGFPEDVRKFLVDRGQGDKPVMVTEFGGGAMYGYHTFDDIRWTEEYQERLMRKALTVFIESKDICGTYPWQFCDIRSAEECILGRPRGFNNKGILNEHRKPKLAYRAVKEIYGKLAESEG